MSLCFQFVKHLVSMLCCLKFCNYNYGIQETMYCVGSVGHPTNKLAYLGDFKVLSSNFWIIMSKYRGNLAKTRHTGSKWLKIVLICNNVVLLLYYCIIVYFFFLKRLYRRLRMKHAPKIKANRATMITVKSSSTICCRA